MAKKSDRDQLKVRKNTAKHVEKGQKGHGPSSTEASSADIYSERSPTASITSSSESLGDYKSDHLSTQFIDSVIQSLEWGDAQYLQTLTEDLHVADLADLIESLPTPFQAQLVQRSKDALNPELLIYLSENTRPMMLETLGLKAFSAALTELDSDDALSVIESLDPQQQRAVLKAIPAPERAGLEHGLSYPEDSAGRLVQQEVVVVPPFWSVEQTLSYLHKATDLPDTFDNLYIVDPHYDLKGVVPLNRLLRAEKSEKLKDMIEDRLKSIPATMDQKEVAYFFRHYSLVSAPVVDDQGHLLGIITADDIVDVVEEETERDVLLLAGVGETDFKTPLFETFYRRVGWLSVTLIDALLTTLVIDLFRESIERMVLLAVLMPVVSAMSGNAGMQAVTITVRGLATRELRSQNIIRALYKELFVGGLNGLFFACLVIMVAFAYLNDPTLAIILAGAMVFNMLWAALAGVLIPWFIEQLDFDPAVASGPILVALTDVIGYITFLGFATWILL